jgi:hypothetical protein
MDPWKSDGLPRRFMLQRNTDVSGVSGTGHVADGVVWPDGTVAVRWRTPHASTAIWASFEAVEIVHGHNGATRVVWIDGDGQPEPPPADNSWLEWEPTGLLGRKRPS